MPSVRKLDDEQVRLVRETAARRRDLAQRLTDLRTQYKALWAEFVSLPSTPCLARSLGISVRSLFDVARGITYKRVNHADGNED